MVLNKKVTGRALPLPAGLSIGLGISVSITLIFAALITQMIMNEVVGEEWIGYGGMVILPIAAAAGALTAAMTVKRRWLLVSLAAGGVYFLFLLGMNSFFFGGQFQGVGTTAALILLGVLMVGVLGLKREGKGRKSRRRYRPR